MFHLDRAQLKALLAAIPDDRNRLMVLVAFNHGLRVSEVINLKGANIRDGHIKVQRLKGSLKTVQPYVKHPDADLDESEALTQLAATTRPGERLFAMTRFGADKLIRRAGAKAGLPAHLCHFHVLKHSVAAQSIQQAGVENVRQWLGHKSIASTGAYLRVSDQAAARAILAAL
jgi:type 1 fimbriae regulatory protein FimB